VNGNNLIKKDHVKASLLNDLSTELKESKEKILAVLKMILNNDELASQYILFNLLAKPYQRKDGFILGNYSINLTDITIPQAKHLSKFIQSILPLTLYMPLTIDNLENKRLTPRKNYDTNLLEPGLF
jgi:hypothetical protein